MGSSRCTLVHILALIPSTHPVLPSCRGCSPQPSSAFCLAHAHIARPKLLYCLPHVHPSGMLILACQVCHAPPVYACAPARGTQQHRVRLDMATAAQATTESLDEEGSLNVKIDNESDPECTVLTVEGKDQPHLLMTLSGALTTAGFLVRTQRTRAHMRVFFVVQVPHTLTSGPPCALCAAKPAPCSTTPVFQPNVHWALERGTGVSLGSACGRGCRGVGQARQGLRRGVGPGPVADICQHLANKAAVSPPASRANCWARWCPLAWPDACPSLRKNWKACAGQGPPPLLGLLHYRDQWHALPGVCVHLGVLAAKATARARIHCSHAAWCAAPHAYVL